MSEPLMEEGETVQARNVRETIALGAEVVGGAVGALQADAVGGLAGALLGSVLGPAVSVVCGDIFNRVLTRKERTRMGAVLIAAHQRFQHNLQQGLLQVEANDVNSGDGRELLEGVLSKARYAYREKKLRLLGNVYGNYPFVKEMPVDDAHQLLGLLEALSYRQITILAMIGRGEVADLKSSDYRDGSRQTKMGTIAVLQEIYDLAQCALVICQARGADVYDFLTGWHDVIPSNLRLAPLGKALELIAGLAEIAPDEYADVRRLLEGG
jgi:hypothetical protein